MEGMEGDVVITSYLLDVGARADDRRSTGRRRARGLCKIICLVLCLMHFEPLLGLQPTLRAWASVDLRF